MIGNRMHSCLECIHRWKNFENLTEEELELVNENRFETEFDPGEIIFKQGSPASNALFLISGLAKAFIDGYGGKRMVLSILKPSRMIAGPGTYVDSRHHYSVAALTHTKACFIDMKVFKGLVHENSRFAEGWLKDISHKSLHSFYKMISLSQKKMHGRLAETLLHLADDIYGADEYSMDLTRQELGELSNMAKESVVRILKEFAADGIIKENCPNINILDKEKLIMISNNG